MSDAAPAVVVMARAPRRGTVHLALEPLIGVDGCVALHTALLARTIVWAREVARDRVFIAYEPADARAELSTLLGVGPTFFPQNGEGIASRTAAASAHVFATGERPLLIVWPVLSRLTLTHAEGALEDLASSGFDGRFPRCSACRSGRGAVPSWSASLWQPRSVPICASAC